MTAHRHTIAPDPSRYAAAMIGPAEADDIDRLRALLPEVAALVRKRMGENAGDLIQALIDGNRAAVEAAHGMDRDAAIDDAAACLWAAADELAQEWAANMGKW